MESLKEIKLGEQEQGNKICRKRIVLQGLSRPAGCFVKAVIVLKWLLSLQKNGIRFLALHSYSQQFLCEFLSAPRLKQTFSVCAKCWPDTRFVYLIWCISFFLINWVNNIFVKSVHKNSKIITLWNLSCYFFLILSLLDLNLIVHHLQHLHANYDKIKFQILIIWFMMIYLLHFLLCQL